jgi:predicted amidohydrolase
MNAVTLACAPSGLTWADVQRQVKRLQSSIVKATRENLVVKPGAEKVPS